MTVTTLNEAGFSPADIVLYTGHRNQSSLINYTSLTADKAGAITEALMGRETVSEEDEPAPPIIHSSPTGTPKRKRQAFDIDIESILSDEPAEFSGKGKEKRRRREVGASSSAAHTARRSAVSVHPQQSVPTSAAGTSEQSPAPTTNTHPVSLSPQLDQHGHGQIVTSDQHTLHRTDPGSTPSSYASNTTP